jgi:hypothetical protein
MERRSKKDHRRDDESHRTSSVAERHRARIRQNDDSYFGSNFSATPFMQ